MPISRIALFSSLVLTSPLLLAQNAQLAGVVSDPSKAVIPHASIKILNEQTQETIVTQSNDSGFYAASALKPGLYRITVTASGFQSQIVDHATIAVAGKINLDVMLHAGGTSEVVTVDASGLEINTTDATVSTVIDRQFVNNIPLNGRSFQSLLTAVPGVSVVPSSGPGNSGEFTVNGQRTEGNYFTVDGVAANTGASPSGIGFGGGFSGTTPNQTVLGTTQSLLSVDALQEFRATTSSFSAECGRTPGGQFSIVSRSGTSQLHGTAYDYLRNDALDANNTFNKRNGLPRIAERQNDFGGTVGGPVWIPHLYNGREKTFFFFSYEGLRLRTPVAAALTGVPNLTIRQDPAISAQLRKIFNSYPVPNGPDRGNGLATFTAGYSSPSKLDASSLRLDHSFSERFKIFGRAAYTPSSITTRDSGDLATVTASKGKTRLITLGATNIFSALATNDLRFNLTANDADTAQSSDNFGGATPFALTDLPGFVDPTRSTFIFNFFYDIRARMYIAPAATRQRQINVVDTFSTALGRHSLRFGVDYRRLITSESRPQLYEFAYVTALSQIYSNSMSGIVAQKYSAAMRPVYQNYSAFAQDEWKVTPRLNLSMGLRWDVNPAPHDDAGNDPYGVTTANPATAQVAAKGTKLWQTRYGNVAPRLGLAYQVHQGPGHETVLRLGGGLFFDVGTTNASNGYSGLGASATITPSGIAFPLTQAQIDAIPAPNTSAPYGASVYAPNPRLNSPYSLQWNAAVEQALGQNQTLTLSYVASLGRQLCLAKQYLPFYLGNTNFTPNAYLLLTNNGAASNYNAFQVQFNRRLSHGLQALASYTWSHSIDDATNNASVFTQLRSASDYDIRNNFQLAMTYDVPGSYGNPFAAAALKHWSFVTRVTARSALPIDLIGFQQIGAGSALQVTYHPNVVPGAPIYLHDPTVPSGRRINPGAFTTATSGGVPVEGNSGRNSVRGYDAVEANVAVQRDFPIHERFGLLFRMEAFNVLNHPIYGAVYNNLSQTGLFGTTSGTLNSQLGGLNSLYQTGGPRSMQAALKLHF
ncbi:TonB-dependent receptor [Granulicella sp. dw_53]|uniref:TonB-dependent receptor n=1 Tax=Granulicella sp. dw_53 TaxID=2719792 RepID=UPI001BD22F51|nr:TonB-dependent receptor [Granulicella sp. dw_53]